MGQKVDGKNVERTEHRIVNNDERTKVKNNKRRMRHNVEWSIRTNGNYVESNKFIICILAMSLSLSLSVSVDTDRGTDMDMDMDVWIWS